jgi:hypothetical protein
VRPRALAVLRLIISSSLVGCSVAFKDFVDEKCEPGKASRRLAPGFFVFELLFVSERVTLRPHCRSFCLSAIDAVARLPASLMCDRAKVHSCLPHL